MKVQTATWRSLVLLVFLSSSLSCRGVIGEAGPEGAPEGPGGGTWDPEAPAVVRFACEGEALEPSPPLRRMSAGEYRRTLFDLFAQTTSPEMARTLLADAPLDDVPEEALAAEISSPDGLREAHYSRLSQAVSQVRVNNQVAVASAIGAAVADSSEAIDALMGACALNERADDDRACLEDFIRSFGRLAFRAPVDDEEIRFLLEEAYIDGETVNAEGVGELVAVMLLAPRFLYHIELGTGDDALRRPLSNHELASRLAYHFTGSMPDAELRRAADEGELTSGEGYAAQVERLVSAPESRELVGSFFAEWLGVSELERLDEGAGTARFDAFFREDIPSEALNQAMIDELASFASYAVFDEEGSLNTLFTSNASFPADEGLARIYGVEAWSEGPPRELPPEERAGVLTRAAFLAIPSTTPHPILRGVALLRDVLCVDLPEPPADIEIPDLDEAMGSRAFAEALTENNSCQSCHQRINPLGFTLGHYDALGRYVENESVVDDEGIVLNAPEVDASAEIRLGAEVVSVDDGVALSELLGASAEVEACFARQVFRFTHRRYEDVSTDGCALETVREAVAGGSILDGLRAAALHPEFRLHRVQGEER